MGGFFNFLSGPALCQAQLTVLSILLNHWPTPTLHRITTRPFTVISLNTISSDSDHTRYRTARLSPTTIPSLHFCCILINVSSLMFPIIGSTENPASNQTKQNAPHHNEKQNSRIRINVTTFKNTSTCISQYEIRKYKR
jgi:hypothetical protein